MNTPEKKSSKARIITWTIASILSLGLVVAVGAPNFFTARSTSCANACINNLRQIDAAINQFALEHNLPNGTTIHYPEDLTPYIKLNSAGMIPPCPDGGTYSVGKVGDAPVCSIGAKVKPVHILW